MTDKTNIQYAVNIANRMITDRSESGLSSMLEWMDNAWHSYWTLDDAIKDTEWVHRVTSTDPHDAVRAGARTLATVMPKIRMTPNMNNEETRSTFNQTEKALQWIFELASRRRKVSLLRDIVLSALLYDEIIISTWYLPYQEKIMAKMGGDTKRLKAARRYGDFVIKVHNPQDTIVEYSDLMTERVLIKSIVTVQEAVDMWGQKSKELLDHLDESKHKYCAVYDYNEIGWRSVFVNLQGDSVGYDDVNVNNAIEIINEATPYDFLPIAAKIGGTSLSNSERYRRIPLLWSLYNSGQWETQNILETLLASEALAYAVSPRYAISSEFDEDVPQLNFRDPARIIQLHRGQAMQDLRPPQLNQGLEILADRVAQRIDKSTVPRVLQSGDYPAGSAFASLNLATQSGMKSLTPYKELAEQVMVDMFVNILNWIHFTGDKIRVYAPEKKVNGMSDFPMGEQIGFPKMENQAEIIDLDSSYFDIENIYMQVELTEDVPTDFMAKINAGGMLVERLNASYQDAMEFVGINDPREQLELRMSENIKIAGNQAETAKIVNTSNLQLMKLQEDLQEKLQQVMEMMAQLQQAQQAQQAQQGGGPGGQPMAPGGPGGQPMAPGGMGPGQDGQVPPEMQQLLAMRRNNPNAGVFPGGEGNNPAGGGISPVQAAPGVGLREGTQQARGE